MVKFSINSASDAKKFEEKKAKMKKGAPGCSHGECSIDGVLVVAKEGKLNGKRFNATITVYSPDGTETSFVGSTLPDNFNYIDENGEPSVAVDPGIYKLNKGSGTHDGAPFYNVLTLNGSWYLPSKSYSETEKKYSKYDASGILIHKAEDGYTSNPWSTGCITIEESINSKENENMHNFANLVEDSATLIIIRE